MVIMVAFLGNLTEVAFLGELKADIHPITTPFTLDPVENAPRPRPACEKYSFGNKNIENDNFLMPGLSLGLRPGFGRP